jgi:hypothetical protein
VTPLSFIQIIYMCLIISVYITPFKDFTCTGEGFHLYRSTSFKVLEGFRVVFFFNCWKGFKGL